MGRKVKLPHIAAGKLVDRTHHAPYQFGIVEQEQRNGRIAYVHGSGTAVGEAFLGDEQYLSFGVHGNLMGSDSLTVADFADFRIFFAAGPDSIVE